MSRWVCEIRLDHDGDPGAELIALLKTTFGPNVRTLTKAEWLVDQERTPPPAFRTTQKTYQAEHQDNRRRGNHR